MGYSGYGVFGDHVLFVLTLTRSFVAHSYVTALARPLSYLRQYATPECLALSRALGDDPYGVTAVALDYYRTLTECASRPQSTNVGRQAAGTYVWPR